MINWFELSSHENKQQSKFVGNNRSVRGGKRHDHKEPQGKASRLILISFELYDEAYETEGERWSRLLFRFPILV